MPSRMMPLYPAEGTVHKQLEYAHALIERDARLSNCLPAETVLALSDVMDIIGTYHSSRIEGYEVEPEVFTQAVADQDGPSTRVVRSLHDALMVMRKRVRSCDFKAYGSSTVQMAHRLFCAEQVEHMPGAYRQGVVTVGKHVSVESEAVPGMVGKLLEFHARASSKASKLISLLALHHRLVWIHPFLDGNGRVARLILQLAMSEAGFSALWSISRGLSLRVDDYYRALAGADQPRMGDLDGRGNLSDKRLVEFVQFMLEACEQEIDYAAHNLERDRLVRCIDAYFLDEALRPAGVTLDSHLAWKALFFQGAMPRGEFKRLIPKGDRTATGQVAALAKADLVITTTSRSDLKPKIPMPLARLIFPAL